MKRLLTGIFVGIVIGSVGGQLALLLPPFWSVACAFVLSLAVSFWALSSMRELDRRKRIIDEMMHDLIEANIRETDAKLAAEVRRQELRAARSHKDFGPPLQ